MARALALVRDPAERVADQDARPNAPTPRFVVSLRGGRAGRLEVCDVPADADGIAHLLGFLAEREGWVIEGAEVRP